jgi:Uma2 family endonuclease
MTLAPAEPILDRNRLLATQHLALDGVPWSFYETVLDQIGNGATRVTYHNGRIEIMAPLAEHEAGKRANGRLIDVLTLELNIPMSTFGSTTFRREDRQAGLETDECYHLKNAPRVRGMKRFDRSTPRRTWRSKSTSPPAPSPASRFTRPSASRSFGATTASI